MTAAPPRRPARTGRAAQPPPPPFEGTQYAVDVAGGKIIAGKYVRLACERHLSDLDGGHERGLWFDVAAASRAVGFFGFLKHSKGEWAGRPLTLRPWQAFIIGCLFGWMREYGQCASCEAWAVLDPLGRQITCGNPDCVALPSAPAKTAWVRRFRTAYEEIARKNGKSTLAAGVGLLLAFFDDEPGAEVYAAATKRDQAKIVWGEAARMVKASVALNKRITLLTSNMHVLTRAQKFEPLGADNDSTDGLNIHGAIVDELHAHKTRSMVDVLETATGARRQPLINYITTAGYDRHSVCWEKHDYGVKVLEGVFEDDSYFAFIAALDIDDDWTDPANLAKANPNLGVSVKLDDLMMKCDRAKQVPGQQNAFRRLHGNVWTEQAERWLDIAVYDENTDEPDPDELKGRPGYAGLDLSSTTDLTALEIYFPDEAGEGGAWLSFYFVPAENIRRRAERDGVPYDVWRDQGFIVPTEGNVVDYDFLREKLNSLVDDGYEIQEVAYDPWNATQLVTNLMSDGFTCVPIRQGFASLAAPTKEFEKLLLARRFRMGKNPVTRWAASNVAVEQDAAGNLKPSKKKSTERIDPMVAKIMALDRATRHEDEGDSKYETEPLEWLC